MNEDVINKANEMILNMIAGLEAAGEFVVAEAPVVVQQLLTWHVVKASIGLFAALIGFAISAAAVVVLRKLWADFAAFNKGKSYSETKDETGLVIMSVVAGFAVVFMVTVGAVSFMSNIYRVAQIWIAPDLYLLEYASRLIN